MTEKYFLAIDQGTSSSRAIVFDSNGQIRGLGQQQFDMHFPADGWVEQDPEVLWQTTLFAGREGLKQASLRAADIAAIGITNQRETTLLWDAASADTLHNAIVWQDRRTAEVCAKLEAAGHQEQVAALTGLRLDPYFSGTKLAWLLDHVPDARTRAEAGKLQAGTVDTFLIHRLTKGARHVTDATNASRTLLFDIGRQQWSEAMAALLRVPLGLMPQVLDSAADFGIAHKHWFGAPIPICGVAGDQQAALVGQGCLTPGMSKCTFGTGCFAMTNTGSSWHPSTQGLLATVAYRLGGQPTYALEGSVFAAGIAIKWLQDQLGLIDAAADTEAAAARTGGDSGGVTVVPAFTGLGAPYWDPDARGLITGLTLDSTADQIITATVDAVALQAADLNSAMVTDGATPGPLRVDGGMVVNDWFCQRVADLLERSVARPAVTETTALGAAMLAAVGSGALSSLTDMANMWRQEKAFEPAISRGQREQELARWAAAVARARSQQ
ncbi:MAG: glycerol kinase GlpK [Pseudomonadales bacterium]